MKIDLNDWPADVRNAITLCKEWAEQVKELIQCEVYLFGSAIYRGGDQFNELLSDLDIVVVLDDGPDATQRVEAMECLRWLKSELELRLISELHRENCTEPAISVVPITQIELSANVHKSGVRRFFTRNFFLDLTSDDLSITIPGAGTAALADERRQALEYVQRIRNEFLSESANKTGGLAPFDGADPVPKTLARVAAQLEPNARDGEWYDTLVGLDIICAELFRRRSHTKQLEELQRKISVRRNARGRWQPITPSEQLLLSEILFDLAAAIPLAPMKMWHITFFGVVQNDAERARIIEELKRLVPDAEIIGIFYGSIMVSLRSSLHSYETIVKLGELDALKGFFGVESVEISGVMPLAGADTFERQAPIDRIVERISQWPPPSLDSMQATEAALAGWLQKWIGDDDAFDLRASLDREVTVGEGSRALRVDILVTYRSGIENARIVVELVSLRNRANFFNQLERLLQLGIPAILVVLGEQRHLEGLRKNIAQLDKVSAQVRIVPIVINNK